MGPAAISVVIPVYNEQASLAPLQGKLTETLSRLSGPYEMIYVNDGSTDASAVALDQLAAADAHVKVLHFRRNFGQTAAMMAGIDHASGDIIIPMDGDLQTDPGDIPLLLAKLEEGYDVCSGWRRDRQDNPVKRNFPSRCANWLISRVSGVHLHDYGCSFKAYRREVIQGVKLYGEMHRLIPIYASWRGARVTEVPVSHHPREHGESKYGMERVIKVLLDLMVVSFLARYAQKPIYVFGMVGLLNWFVAVLAGASAVYYKLWGGKTFVETPLPLLFVMCIITGLLCMLMGLLAELVMRTYYESQGKTTYLIAATRNLEPGS